MPKAEVAPKQKILVIQAAALGYDLIQGKKGLWQEMNFQPLTPPIPAVTCTAQATFRTGSSPATHGMVANGLYHKNIQQPMFWEQSSNQVAGNRIWEDFRNKGGKVGMMFWQQSLGEDIDLVLSPRPIHKHGGGMIQDCYSQPHDLYKEICAKTGKSFNLMHYWGPLASAKSSEWITKATCEVMKMADAPELLLTYLPHLDYDLQRAGPHKHKATRALKKLEGFLQELIACAKEQAYEVIIFGDYAIHATEGGALFPNRILRDAELLWTRSVKGMAILDQFNSPAVGVADHEICHIHVKKYRYVKDVLEAFARQDGIDKVLKRDEAEEIGLNHRNSGDVILLAKPGYWFAYPWWANPKEAPDYATHVDIHNKPGFDPCELFFGALPWQVSMDTRKVGGSHGAVGPNSQAAWTSTIAMGEITSLEELGQAVKARLT